MWLQNLQADFAEVMLSNDTNNELLDHASNLLIYKNNMQSVLIKNLESIYPLVVKLLANDYFNWIAKEYIERYPSVSGNLHEYGEYLSDFLASFPPLSHLGYLPEVAHFEWLCHQLYFAAESPPFDIQKLSLLQPEQYPSLYFSLNTTCILHQFHFPLLRIIDLCKGERDDIIDVNAEGVNLLIQRRHFEIILTPLTKGAFNFLFALQENHPLSNALEAALMVEPTFNLEEKLSFWIKTNIIVDCY